MKIIGTIVAALIATLATTAGAGADVPPENASVDFPLYRQADAAPSGDTVIQLEAPGRSWGLRPLAQSIDASIDGLTIKTNGTCASDPTAICVRVVFDYWSAEEQAAITYGESSTWGGVCICDDPSSRVIYVNRRTTYAGPERAQVTAHEFGHALGLGHHRSEGLTSYAHATEVLSVDELVVLRNWYMNPRFAPSA